MPGSGRRVIELPLLDTVQEAGPLVLVEDRDEVARCAEKCPFANESDLNDTFIRSRALPVQDVRIDAQFRHGRLPHALTLVSSPSLCLFGHSAVTPA